MHADRFNRAALLVFGLVLLVLGAGALIMSVGVLKTGYSHEALFDNFVSNFIGDNGQWFWPAAAVLGAVVAVLVLRWIAAILVSTDRSGDLIVPGSKRVGRTQLRHSAVTQAVTAELTTYRGIESAKARTLGDPAAPNLVVDIVAERGTDLAELAQRVETEALAHVRTAVGHPEMRIRVNFASGSRQINRI